MHDVGIGAVSHFRSPNVKAIGLELGRGNCGYLLAYIGINRSPLPQNNGNLPLPIFGGT